jgi:hypothetical protein
MQIVYLLSIACIISHPVDGEIGAMNTALAQLFSRTGSFIKAVIFSDSTAATLSIAKFVALPSKRLTEIH